MSAISFSECDGCGLTQPEEGDSPLKGLAPDDWYELRRPFDRGTFQRGRSWACSIECMVQIVLTMNAEQSTPGWWALEPMVMPGSSIAHAFSFRDQPGPRQLSQCSAVRFEQCEPATRSGLRPCKRCAAWADQVEPGWFGVPDFLVDSNAVGASQVHPT
jgi:hypothetical protein